MTQVRIGGAGAYFDVVSGEWEEYLATGYEARAIARTDYGESTPVQLSWAGDPPIEIPESGTIPYLSATSRCSLNWGDPVTNTLDALPGGESYMPWRFRSQMNIGTLLSVSYEGFWYADPFSDYPDISSQVNQFTFDFMGETVLREDCPTSPSVGELQFAVSYDPDLPRARAQMTWLLWDDELETLRPVTYTIDIEDPATTATAGPVTDFRVGLAHRLTSVNLPEGHIMGYFTAASAFYVPPDPPEPPVLTVRGVTAVVCGETEC